jgi:cytoskeletal protein CcmA (bactofilin family)
MWKKPENSRSNEEFSSGKTPALESASAPKRLPAPAELARVGSSIVISGDISGAEDILIEGKVIGTISLPENSVEVGRSGKVEANVFAKRISVEGDVKGDIKAYDQVVVKSSGHVRGNITAPRVIIEDGAKIRGSIDMEDVGSSYNSTADATSREDIYLARNGSPVVVEAVEH